MTGHQPLSSAAHTAYAQVLDAVLGSELTRSVAHLPGTFSRKQVKGRTYWYYQYMDVGGRKRQTYVGPESARVLDLVKAHGDSAAPEAIERLARSALALGNTAVAVRHFRVVQRLADYGFFRAGGVLVGTHAFVAFGNMLGVRWSQALLTQDVDFAHAGKSLAVALPTDLELDVHAAIESLQMGLLPIQHMDGTTGASYLDPDDPAFCLDFLTPLHRGGMKPYRHRQLGILLQPLKFMEYLLEGLEQAALLGPGGAVLVNLPDPARYALHKLIVAGERPLAKAAKARKDLEQAAALIEVLVDHSGGGGIAEAWADLVSRGPGWRSRAWRGLERLAKLAPDLPGLSLLLRPGS